MQPRLSGRRGRLRPWRSAASWQRNPSANTRITTVTVAAAAAVPSSFRALPDHLVEPPVQMAVQRFLTHVGAAIEGLEQVDGPGSSGAPGAVHA